MDSASTVPRPNCDILTSWAFVDVSEGRRSSTSVTRRRRRTSSTIDDMWLPVGHRLRVSWSRPWQGRAVPDRRPGYEEPLPDSGFNVAQLPGRRCRRWGYASWSTNPSVPAAAIRERSHLAVHAGRRGNRGRHLPGEGCLGAAPANRPGRRGSSKRRARRSTRSRQTTRAIGTSSTSSSNRNRPFGKRPSPRMLAPGSCTASHSSPTTAAEVLEESVVGRRTNGDVRVRRRRASLLPGFELVNMSGSVESDQLTAPKITAASVVPSPSDGRGVELKIRSCTRRPASRRRCACAQRHRL